MARARRVLQTTWRHFRSDRVGDLAAMLTYYTLFAIFPFALFVVSITLLVLPASTLDEGVELIVAAMPPQVADLTRRHLEGLIAATSGEFALAGAALALWGASRGSLALGRALNSMHGVKETRGFWHVQATAILTTLGVSVIVLVALGLLLLGPILGHRIADRFGLGPEFDLVWDIGRWLGAALLVMLVWAILLYVLPNVRRPFRWVTPGAFLATLIWIGISQLFALYVANFGRYERAYGALGAVIVSLTWLWLTNFALLLGGEIDDALDALRRERLAREGIPREARRLQTIVRTKEESVEQEHFGDVARRIGDDLQVLARDHIELARREVTQGLRAGIIDAVTALLGGIVALIGFAMLCVTAVVVLAPVIPALWVRLLIMSLVYLALGTGLAAGFAKKLKRDLPPKLDRTALQARQTARAVKEQVQHG